MKTAPKSLEEQLSEALENTPAIEIDLETDENGNLIIDKERYPDLYEWAVDG
jgi:hypothetical protein